MFGRRIGAEGFERRGLNLMGVFCKEENWVDQLIALLLGTRRLYLSSRKCL